MRKNPRGRCCVHGVKLEDFGSYQGSERVVLSLQNLGLYKILLRKVEEERGKGRTELLVRK